MSKQIATLRDLFIEQGRELYDTTRQEQKELPRMQKQVSNKQLKQLIDKQVSTAKDQQKRLENAFKKLNEKPDGEKSECCKAIITQGNKLAERAKNSNVRDAAIITAAQRLSHNKITALGTLSAYARQIGQQEVANMMHEALGQEKAIDNELSELAERDINKNAMAAVAM